MCTSSTLFRWHTVPLASTVTTHLLIDKWLNLILTAMLVSIASSHSPSAYLDPPPLPVLPHLLPLFRPSHFQSRLSLAKSAQASVQDRQNLSGQVPSTLRRQVDCYVWHRSRTRSSRLQPQPSLRSLRGLATGSAFFSRSPVAVDEWGYERDLETCATTKVIRCWGCFPCSDSFLPRL